MIQNVLGGLFGKVLDNAEGILDKVITTDKERDEAKLAIKSVMLEKSVKLLQKKLKIAKMHVICIKTMLLSKRY